VTEQSELLVFGMTALFVALCVASDVRTLRIPNALTGPAIAAGVALHTWYLGWTGVQTSLAGFGLAVLLLLGPFALGGIGAGDVKMMGAIGALVGPRLLVHSLIVGLALGGILAVVRLAALGRLREKMANLGRMLGNAALVLSVEPLKVSPSSPDAVVLPYSVPLGIGTLVAIALAVVRTP
jgi:prepilin peptidase CpaA